MKYSTIRTVNLSENDIPPAKFEKKIVNLQIEVIEKKES